MSFTSSAAVKTGTDESRTGVIKKNSTLEQALFDAGVARSEAYAAIAAARKSYDLRRLQAGTRFQLFRELGPITALRALHLELSPIQTLEIGRNDKAEWIAELKTREISIESSVFSGTVNSTLWNSAVEAGMDPEIIVELAEIFAWQVDFAREVRPGDEWRLSVEKKLVEGKAVGWGRVTAAEYRNAGELYSAVLFRRDGKELGYFAPDGSSLRKMFLKSPLRYGRISSGFTRRRFHPILAATRAHQGVDYGVPTGTPVRAVGDGTVAVAGFLGGGGNTVKIRHNSTYQTAYKHLSGFAAGIGPGRRVRQGEVIGYVGSTGLSTGPHLHFEFLENGAYKNPLGRKFPSASPVPTELLAEFRELCSDLQRTLPPWFRPGISSLGARIRQVSSVKDEG